MNDKKALTGQIHAEMNATSRQNGANSYAKKLYIPAPLHTKKVKQNMNVQTSDIDSLQSMGAIDSPIIPINSNSPTRLIEGIKHTNS